jgi:hypothetical protein
VLVLLVALAAFGYFLCRVSRPSDPWPEETFWPRIEEAGNTGLFLPWVLGFALRPGSSGALQQHSEDDPPKTSGGEDRTERPKRARNRARLWRPASAGDRLVWVPVGLARPVRMILGPAGGRDA